MSVESYANKPSQEVNESGASIPEFYLKTYGPKLGREFYEEAIAKREWEKVLWDILHRLTKRITPVKEGKNKFILLATGHKAFERSGYPEIDPSYSLRFREVEEVVTEVQQRFDENEIAVIRRDRGRFRGDPIVTYWYAYSPKHSNPKSLSFRAAIKWDIFKRMHGKYLALE